MINNHLHWERHFTPELVTVHNLLDESEIHSLIYAVEDNYALNKSTIADGTDNSVEIRNSKQFFITFETHPEFHWLFKKLNNKIDEVNEEFFQLDLHGYKEIQYTKYESIDSNHYDWHMDMILGNRLNEDKTGIMTLGTRKLSLVLLLSEPEVDFEGGFLEFNVQSEKFSLTASMNKGTVVFFPSYLLHRVTNVTSGIRRSLVVWVTGPKLK